MSQVGYRKINFPKIDWEEDPEHEPTPELSKDIYKSLKEDLDTITNKEAINPHEIQEGLRSINFHKEQPEIYKIIEEMCLEYDLKGRDMTTEQILKYIVSTMSDNKTRKGLNAVFDSIKDRKTGEITPRELTKLSEENEQPMSERDFQFILKYISGPSSSININQDEFYYIMTKSPEEALKITLATKSSKVK
jgi:Ca2+-binding EF-hand superfamily protein